MRAEVTIMDKSGQNENDLTQAAVELMEGLVSRKCREFRCRANNGTCVVAFDMEDVPVLSKSDLKQAIAEFNGDDQLTCRVSFGESYRSPDDGFTTPKCRTLFGRMVDKVRSLMS